MSALTFEEMRQKAVEDYFNKAIEDADAELKTLFKVNEEEIKSLMKTAWTHGANWQYSRLRDKAFKL